MTLAPTPSQTVGPFFSFSLCREPVNELVDPDADDALRITGRVLDGAGEPVPDAMVEIWQADADGAYRPHFGWGRCGTDGEGRYSFATVKPGSLPGANGDAQAPHLVVLAFARGLLKPVLTRMYFPDEGAANAADPVLAAVGEPAGLVAVDDGDTLRFDIRLQGDRQTPFFAF